MHFGDRLRAVAPRRAKRGVLRALDIAKRAANQAVQHLPGERPRQCTICERVAFRFGRFGRPARPDARCDHCGALERQRLMTLYFRQRTALFGEAPLSVLHFAPERCFERTFVRPGLDYVSCDLMSPTAQVQADITALPFEDQRFDAVICAHVLEHIDDDRRAMRELRRVLRPEGWALIMVPLGAGLTSEDPEVTDPQERLQKYGQRDHVRLYGVDIAVRLTEAGFEVQRLTAQKLADESTIQRAGLRRDEIMFICTPAER